LLVSIPSIALQHP